MNTKTETLSVWLPDWVAHEVQRAGQMPLSSLAFCHLDSSMEKQGWIKVGTAEATVTYLPSAVATEQAEALIRAQMAEAAGKHEALQTELQARLNSLLAITNEVEA